MDATTRDAEIRERYVAAINAWTEATGAVYLDMTPYQFEAYRAWELSGHDVAGAKSMLNLRQIAQKGIEDRCRP